MPEVALDALELEAHALAQLGVEIGQRLVEQQELGLHDERPGQREALLLAAGQLGGLALGKVVESDRGEHLHHLLADLPGACLRFRADPQAETPTFSNTFICGQMA